MATHRWYPLSTWENVISILDSFVSVQQTVYQMDNENNAMTDSKLIGT